MSERTITEIVADCDELQMELQIEIETARRQDPEDIKDPLGHVQTLQYLARDAAGLAAILFTHHKTIERAKRIAADVDKMQAQS